MAWSREYQVGGADHWGVEHITLRENKIYASINCDRCSSHYRTFQQLIVRKKIDHSKSDFEKYFYFNWDNDEESAPFTFKFFGDDSSERYVLVDSRVPFINSQPLSCTNWLGLAEKAYAKLRYCYKGTLGVGIQQVIFELTGTLPLKLGSDGDKDHP